MLLLLLLSYPCARCWWEGGGELDAGGRGGERPNICIHCLAHRSLVVPAYPLTVLNECIKSLRSVYTSHFWCNFCRTQVTSSNCACQLAAISVRFEARFVTAMSQSFPTGSKPDATLRRCLENRSKYRT